MAYRTVPRAGVGPAKRAFETAGSLSLPKTPSAFRTKDLRPLPCPLIGCRTRPFISATEVRDGRIVHFNVTTNPTARWTAQQIVEAFPFDTAPRFLPRDRDGIYGEYFRHRVEHMGIEEVLIAPRSPWQNPYAERAIGSIRRECLDHVIVLNEDHLHRILAEYFEYYHQARAHLSLDRNSPIPRQVCPPEQGKVVARAYLGGLHHWYTRAP